MLPSNPPARQKGYRHVDAGTFGVQQMADERWIAVYTRPRCERVTARYLVDCGFSSYVPLRRRLHRWSDRSKWVDVPLIPSYVFVLMPGREHYMLYETPGFVRFIMFHGRVARIRPEDLELLRRSEKHDEAMAIGTQAIPQGTRVLITGGMFSGYSGQVLHQENDCAVAISIEELSLAVVVRVLTVDLKVL